jgi:putative iron-regulated protein
MKKLILLSAGGMLLAFAACKKSNNDTTASATQQQVITDFVNKTAMPQYKDLRDKATTLNTAVGTLSTSTTATNLEAARTAWRNVRSAWEQCEGFLIGPVEDDNYDPNMDTWPVDYVQLDSFINSSNNFSLTTVENVNQSLRGFHPLEYLLWGKGGGTIADSLTAKDKQYMVSLAQDVLNSTTKLYDSWTESGGNFQSKMQTSGSGSTLYPKRADAMLAMAAGMAAICEEVANGKMAEPFAATDSTLTESPFSHNSVTDFTNNLIGARTVYLCNYNGQTGSSMSSYVSARNIQLDNKIKDQFAAAISAMNNITATFEMAVHTQRNQIQAATNAINALQTTLNGDLKTYVQTYGKD